MPDFNKATFSNTLILVSIIFTIIWYINPSFIYEWSINSYYFEKWEYFHYLVQLFSWTFIHWWIMHLLFNSIFVYYFWNILEIIIWKNKYILFFITNTLFVWLLLTNLTNDITIWISWFALALLTYYTLELRYKNNPEYKWWITAIVINLAIWLYPWISLYWHLFWVVYWVIFFYLIKNFTKKQLVWLYEYKNIKENTNVINSFNIKKD